MTLNGKNALCCIKEAYFGAHCTHLNDDSLILLGQKCGPMTVVSVNISCMRIFAGVLLDGGVKWEWGCRWRQFLAIWVTTFLETSDIRPAVLHDDMLPLSVCDGLQNEWRRRTSSGYFMSKSVFDQHFLTQIERLIFKNNSVKSNKHAPVQSATEM